MTTLYLTGQSNFGNRGCEALVRSAVLLMQRHIDQPRFLVPSLDIPRDSAQWPEAADNGVEFVPFPPVPSRYLNWARLCRRLPWLTHFPWPALPLRGQLAQQLDRCDAVLSLGGDIISLDYGLDSPFFFSGIADHALQLGKPVVLWGASVGPFTKLPGVERQMMAHLRKLSLLTIRDSHTVTYLKQQGVEANVMRVSDGAYCLQPQTVSLDAFWPTGEGVLGLNISPLVEKARLAGGAKTSLMEETLAFVRETLQNTQLGILLVPHVAPLDGSERNNDEVYLAKILQALGGDSTRVRIVPSGCNSPQLKYVISRCKYFIGARTHATIAAFSSGVPTISIAYSVKARGINLDLFGHERYVLPTPEVSASSLSESLSLLQAEEIAIRDHLKLQIPKCQEEADAGAASFAQIVKMAVGVAQ